MSVVSRGVTRRLGRGACSGADLHDLGPGGPGGGVRLRRAALLLGRGAAPVAALRTRRRVLAPVWAGPRRGRACLADLRDCRAPGSTPPRAVSAPRSNPGVLRPDGPRSERLKKWRARSVTRRAANVNHYPPHT